MATCLDHNLGRTIGIRGSVVERLLVIDVIGAVAALGIWYFLFAAYNRRKGAEALRWVQSACAGKGRVLDSRWLNSSRLHARLQFPSRSFENARVTVKFRPRPLPVHWLLSYWHKQKETLTFEADLGGSPSFHMEVVRHRWCARSRGVSARQRDEREWDVYEPGPDHSDHPHPLEAGSHERTECLDDGSPAGRPPGPLPPRISTVFRHGCTRRAIGSESRRRLPHYIARFGECIGAPDT